MSADGPEIDCIDAMVADLLTNANLPTTTAVVKYRRPRIILPDDCPLLCVVLHEEGSLEAPASTVKFRSRCPISLEWHEAAVDEVTTLVDNEGLSKSLIRNAKAIEARARKWAIATASLGGVDLGVVGVEHLGPAARIPFQLEDGFVEGVQVRVDVLITEAA